MRLLRIVFGICFEHLLLTLALHFTAGAEMREYCNMEVFEARCSADEVIVAESARYGRMRVGRCMMVTYGTMGCSVDALPFLDRRCSGRDKCSIKLPDDALYNLQPCPRDVTSYLAASFTCLRVTSPRPHQCAGQAAMAVTQTATGMWLTSGVVQRGGPGSCALRLEALPGQRLNVTLWDFSGLAQHRSSAAIVSSSSADACRSYGKIGEPGHTHSPVCGGTERIKHVFMSQGYVVDLEYKHLSDDTDARFLLHVRVVGCQTPDLPPGMWHRRVDDVTMQVGCNSTSQVWQWTCDSSHKWQGHQGLCDMLEASGHGRGQLDSPGSFWKSFVYKWSSTTEGLLIIVALGVALGFVIGVILLAIAVAYLRRQSRVQRKSMGQPGGLLTSLYGDVEYSQHHTGEPLTAVPGADSCPYGCMQSTTGTLQHKSYEPPRTPRCRPANDKVSSSLRNDTSSLLPAERRDNVTRGMQQAKPLCSMEVHTPLVPPLDYERIGSLYATQRSVKQMRSAPYTRRMSDKGPLTTDGGALLADGNLFDRTTSVQFDC